MKKPAIGEAPGRLDFMGGVADYSGSLVLETPIRATTQVTVRSLSAPTLRIASAGFPLCELDWKPFLSALRANSSDLKLRHLLDAQGVPHWARYVTGSLLVFCSATRWMPANGLSFHVVSRVPQSSGVSSSAALEMATLRALETLSGIHLKGTRLAHLGQRAENHLVGAPCGLMDQLTAQHGKHGSLLPILCQPDQLGELVKLPAGALVVGWPSGVKHAVSASPYATARTAAFMGKKILETHLKRRWRHAAEIPPSLLYRHTALLPERMSGRQFLLRYRAVDDPLSKIVPGRRYPVRAAVRFPIEENFRCALAESLLRSPHGGALAQVGELMLQSHEGYSAMGLGCPETEEMVDALVKIGPHGGIYGARVSGGGSGGTVVVLLANRALPTLRGLAKRMCSSENGPLPLIV
jgi:L-arabinokinase